jgi:predicted nucleotidyltransferase
MKMQQVNGPGIRHKTTMNAASAWRFELARRVAAAYVENTKVAAIIVGGSTARGRADRFSDLEIGGFWHEPPTDEERLAAASAVAEATGGEVHRLYPYDPEEEVWEDDFFLGRAASDEPGTGLLVEMPHYTVDFIERTLADVLERYDTSDLKQNLISVMIPAIPLHGESLVESWRTRAAQYPRGLAVAMVKKHAQIDHFWRTEMYPERGNNLLLLYDKYVQVANKVLYTLLALNGMYYYGFKWVDLQVAEMRIVPDNFSARLKQVFQSEPRVATSILAQLVEETYSLVERHMPEIDVERLRRIFRYRRHPWEEPPTQLGSTETPVRQIMYEEE